MLKIRKEGEKRGVGLTGGTARMSMVSGILFLKKSEAYTLCVYRGS